MANNFLHFVQCPALPCRASGLPSIVLAGQRRDYNPYKYCLPENNA